MEYSEIVTYCFVNSILEIQSIAFSGRGYALQNAFREFALDGADWPVPDGALPAPGPAFRWAHASRPQRLRRAWLDTFDWRLYRAGLTLEQVSCRGQTELTLTGRDGTVIAAEHLGPGLSGAQPKSAAAPKWPGRLDSLPAGPLRENLGSVVGVRALAPVAKAVSVVRERPALNSDDKTVARVTVDRMSVSYPAAAVPPARLAVTALRGYQPQAVRLADALAAVPGVADVTQSAMEAALAAAGRRPGDYSGKINVHLTPAMPATAALATVLTALLDTLEANVAWHGARYGHRVPARPADRGTPHPVGAQAGRQVLPAGLAGKYRPEFKWLGDLTTPTRDLDVYLLGLPGMAAEPGGGRPPRTLQPFHDHLARQRVGGAAAAGPRACVRPGFPGSPSAGGTTLASRRARPATAHGRERRRQPDRRARTGGCSPQGAAITAISPPESLHDLRKRCKELRYLLEIFGVAAMIPPSNGGR